MQEKELVFSWLEFSHGNEHSSAAIKCWIASWTLVYVWAHSCYRDRDDLIRFKSIIFIIIEPFQVTVLSKLNSRLIIFLWLLYSLRISHTIFITLSLESVQTDAISFRVEIKWAWIVYAENMLYATLTPHISYSRREPSVCHKNGDCIWFVQRTFAKMLVNAINWLKKCAKILHN